ncbi:MAG TPA: hypothetical protein VK654_01335 [Nitrospirota bacterium]|nr:hypothetical protein [Nitrospirota bacterium]
MRTLKSALSLAVLFLAAGTCLAASDTRTELKNIPLEWRPTDKVNAREAIDVSSFMKSTFFISPFTDAREKPEEIGKNIEHRGTDRDLPVTTKENVAAWLTYRFGQVLSELGLDVVKSNGTCRVEGEIRKFYVVESSTYKAEVGMKLRLYGKNGAVLWEGMVSGTASRFGASYRAENYYEAISDAVMTAISGLLRNDEFKQAVKKNI